MTSLLRTMVGSTPSNVFVLCAHCTSLHTRMTWMRLAMIYLGNLGLACNFETIVIPYHLLTCRSFLLYIYNFFTLASDTTS